MFSFKLFSNLSALLLCFLLPLLASSVAVAAPFTVTYTDTISSTGIPGLSGQPAVITIVMENGSATPASQTWTSADVTSITLTLIMAQSLPHFLQLLWMIIQAIL